MLSPAFQDVARRLIAANTVSANGTLAAADVLQPLWEHAGLRVERQVVDGIHVNLLGGPDEPRPDGVLLVTHLDTVPAGPGWRSDPWTLTVDDGFYVGLGVADVKLDALCKAEAARRMQGTTTRRPFWLLGTFGEEVGLRGARHFASSASFEKVRPRWVLCGEPSELQLVTSHKGYAVVKCTVRDAKARPVSTAGPGVEELHFAGKAAHSSTPHLGINAIKKALTWAKSSGAPILGIRGGTSSNVVPASCVLTTPTPRDSGLPDPDDVKFLPPEAPRPNLWRTLVTLDALSELWLDVTGSVGGLNVIDGGEAQMDARLAPDVDPEPLLAAFQARAQEWVRELGQGELTLEIEVTRNAAGMQLPDDAPLVTRIGDVLRRHGLDGSPKPKLTSTEAGVFFRKGCEAVVFGPGVSTGNAHTANERIEMAQLEKACDLYEAILRELCECT